MKYIVSDNTGMPLLIKTDKGKVMSYDSQIAYTNHNGTIELTEQEITDYDPMYMIFAKPIGELKKTYEVTIRETLEKTIKVEAKTTQEASQMVLEDYYSERIVLTYEDYTDDFEIDVKEIEEEK